MDANGDENYNNVNTNTISKLNLLHVINDDTRLSTSCSETGTKTADK